jgi:uncharacterized membrane protein YeaQ/YmgE (transglycosylase-associated protein family)
MSIAGFLFWAAVGWCGTLWPGWWRRPPPPPPPDPWWFVDRIVGIIGGLVGGILFTQAWSITQTGDLGGLSVAASGVGALVGALILLDLYSSFAKRGGGTPVQ